MMSNFDSFLKKMMGETDTPQQNIIEGRMKTGGVKKQTDTPRPNTKPAPRKLEVSESIEDDIVDKAFEYAATFSKIVKKNFPDKSNRKVVLESVRAAINLMLGESVDSVKTASNVRNTVPQKPIEVKAADIDDDNEDPYEVMRRAQISRLPENFTTDNASSDLHIKSFTNSNGETEIDLSHMTNEDMQALRILSGIAPKPEQGALNE